MTIKVNPRDKSIEPFELNEHDGPVLRLDLSVNGLLASSSGDGTLKIWNLDERKVIKTFTDLPKINSHLLTNQYGKLQRFSRMNLCCADVSVLFYLLVQSHRALSRT